MIDVSSMTQLAQNQTAAPDIPRAVAPVAAVEASQKSAAQQNAGSRGGDAEQSANRRQERSFSLDSNTIRVPEDTSLSFRIDKNTDRLVVSMMDANGEVIRQMPSELILRLAERLEQIQSDGQLGLDERV